MVHTRRGLILWSKNCVGGNDFNGDAIPILGEQFTSLSSDAPTVWVKETKIYSCVDIQIGEG